jgi:peptidoglycan/LPS O-acetylase OafA/YrhL
MHDSKVGSNTDRYNLSVNGFRGLCVLLVFGYHVFRSGLPPDITGSPVGAALAYFLGSWRCGVELFFMISGYVIVNSLRRHASLRTFLVDRVLRIFPAWLPVHVAISVGGALTGWKVFADTNAGDWVVLFFTNLLFLPPLIPVRVTHPASWSITYEWIFYLLAAALVAIRRYLTRKTLARISWTVAAGLLLLAFPRALFFLPGVFVALNEDKLRRHAQALRYPAIALLLFLITWQATGSKATFEGFAPATLTNARAFAPIVALLAGTYLMSAVCLSAGMLSEWLRTRTMQLLGNISYSFYLWHPVTMFAVKKIVITLLLPHYGPVAATGCFAIASFAAGLSISIVSRDLIEVKLTKRLREWLKARSQPALPTSAEPVADVGGASRRA